MTKYAVVRFLVEESQRWDDFAEKYLAQARVWKTLSLKGAYSGAKRG